MFFTLIPLPSFLHIIVLFMLFPQSVGPLISNFLKFNPLFINWLRCHLPHHFAHVQTYLCIHNHTHTYTFALISPTGCELSIFYPFLVFMFLFPISTDYIPRCYAV